MKQRLGEVGGWFDRVAEKILGWRRSLEDTDTTVGRVFASIRSTIQTAIFAVRDFIIREAGVVISWWNENLPLMVEVANKVWNRIVEIARAVWKLLQDFWRNYGDELIAIASAVWGAVTTAVDTALKNILGIVKAVLQALNGDWRGAWETLKSTISGGTRRGARNRRAAS
jgi:phage-related protein